MAIPTGIMTRLQDALRVGRLYLSHHTGLVALPGGGQHPTTPKLNRVINRFDVVANTGDSAVLPPCEAERVVLAINNGVHDMQLFSLEASGVTIDGVAGATGVTLGAGQSVLIVATENAWFHVGSLTTSGGGGGSGLTITTSVYTSNTATLAMIATNGLMYCIDQGTPVALTANLPATPATNLTVGIKDFGNGFLVNNCTVKTTDSSTIFGKTSVAGATGYVLDQNGQQNWFTYNGAGWAVW